MTDHPATLYRGGRFYSAAEPRATAMLVRDGRIDWLGEDAEAPSADVAVDLGGALVTPAFVDAHLHATDTGLAFDGLDLSGTRSARASSACSAKKGSLPPPICAIVGEVPLRS